MVKNFARMTFSEHIEIEKSLSHRMTYSQIRYGT